jgi:hypothetical protein
VALTTEAFRAVRRHTDDICKLMEIMSHMSCYPAFKSVLSSDQHSSLLFFRYNSRAIEDMRNRMMLHVKDDLLNDAIMNLMTT